MNSAEIFAKSYENRVKKRSNFFFTLHIFRNKGNNTISKTYRTSIRRQTRKKSKEQNHVEKMERI